MSATRYAQLEPLADAVGNRRSKAIRASADQIKMLQNAYTECTKPAGDALKALSEQIGLPTKWILSWFCRQRRKTKVKTEFKVAGAGAPSSDALSLEEIADFKVEYQDPVLGPAALRDEDRRVSGEHRSTLKKGMRGRRPKVKFEAEAAASSTRTRDGPCLKSKAGTSILPSAALLKDQTNLPNKDQRLGSVVTLDLQGKNFRPSLAELDVQILEELQYPIEEAVHDVPCTAESKTVSNPGHLPEQRTQAEMMSIHSNQGCANADANRMSICNDGYLATPLKHLTVLRPLEKFMTKERELDCEAVMDRLLDETLGETDAFQAAMGLVFLRRLGVLV